jgi:hypothetical protein
VCSSDLDLVTGPGNVLGIEINEYAAELARVSIWIGEIQWRIAHGYPPKLNPVLEPLEQIEHRDALLTTDNTEAAWPPVTVIIGNPPFIGDKIMRGELGDAYTSALRGAFAGRVPGGADFVTYWFEKARAHIAAGQAQAAGLVATNSIRQKRNRVLLERILESTQIFEAWSDEPWVNDGAAVRVSLVAFGNWPCARLDGQPVEVIHADLTGGAASSADLTRARALPGNQDASFFGLSLAGKFKVDTPTALAWLDSGGNPNQRPNSDVLRPIYNGMDITRRWSGHWVIDFNGMDMNQAADYLLPFAWVEREVKPVRLKNKRAARAQHWWQHGEKRPAMRAAMRGQTHYIATPETAKHRFFVRFPAAIAPEHSLIVMPRGDLGMLGLLSSRIHCTWALAVGGTLEDRPRYNASLTFTNFPFPEGFSPAPGGPAPVGAHWSAIAQAAQALEDFRANWLNPPEWVTAEITPAEQAAGLPPRVVPQPAHAAQWTRRTLTQLYNENPAALRLRQEALDAAVAAAYGWADYTPALPATEILRRLLALNLARA